MSCDTVKKNLCVYEGDDKTLSFTSDMGDLTGYQIHFQARVEKSSRYAIIDEVGTVTDTSGGYSISFASADTLGKYREEPYFYDIKLTAPDGKIHTDRYGMFTIEERTTDITQTVVTHKYGVDVSKDGTEVKKEANNINFVGSSVNVSENGEGVNVEVKAPAAAPTLALHFAGIYDDLQSLQDAIPSPSENMQAIVIQPSEKYYHGVGGAWVELAPVGAFHSKYLGVYDTVQDLQTANPSPVTDSLAIIGTADKTFYLYDGKAWDQLKHTDLPSLDARVTDEEHKTSDNVKRLEVAEQHLQTLQTKTNDHDNEISGLGEDVRQLQGQVFTGVHLEDTDGNAFDDINGIVFDGAEVQDDQGTQTSHVIIRPKITVANGQGPDSTSETGNALIFPQATITPDPNDSNVLTVIPHHDDSGSKGINVGDGANASREVQTIIFNGHQAFGSGNTAEIHLEFAHFKTLGERNTWTSKFASHMDYDLIALVDADENGFVAFYRFDAATKAWKDYNAQGVIMSDSDGAIPKNIKTVVYGPGFSIQQAGDQEDAALVTYTPSGDDHSHTAELKISKAYGDYKGVDKVNEIELFYPLEVNEAMTGPGQISPGVATLSISPSAYERQHGNACLIKLDMVKSVSGQHPNAIYMSEEVVPTGMFYQLNPKEFGIDVQDNTGGDTAVTGGQLTEALCQLSFFESAPEDGNIKVWLEYRDPSNPIAKKMLLDVNGNPIAVEKNFSNGNPIGSFVLAGAFMAKATQPLKVMVETSFDANTKITLDPANTMLCLNQFSNGYETSIARIEFMRRAAIQITPAIQKFNGHMLSLLQEIDGVSLDETITAGSGTDTLNEFGVQNLTDVHVKIADGVMEIKDVGNIADFYVDTLIDNTHTRMLRGKDITSSITIANPNNAFEFEAYSWNGKPDHTTQVYSSRNEGNIVVNVGWTVIKGVFIAEQINGNSYGHTLTFTVPDNANNVVIVARPQAAQSPSTLKLSGFDWGATSDFTGYVEIERYHAREEHLRFSENYAEYLLNNQGYQSLRYTINNTPPTGNPMPVGKIAKGKAPVEIDHSVNQVSGSGDPENDGAIKFLKDGEASISKSYNVRNETGTDNTVTFWDVLFDVDGNETKITESEKTVTIKANTGAPGTIITIPAYAIDVESGQRIGGRATSNKKDGAYAEADNVSEYLVQTIIDFKELVAGQNDTPDLVNAPLNKSLVFDRRYHEFSGNSAQNITINNFVIPSDVLLASVTADRKTASGYSSIDEIQHSYNTTTQVMTIHVGGVSDGIVFFDFWSK